MEDLAALQPSYSWVVHLWLWMPLIVLVLCGLAWAWETLWPRPPVNLDQAHRAHKEE